MNDDPRTPTDLWSAAGAVSTAHEFDNFVRQLLGETQGGNDNAARSTLHIAIRALMESSKTNAEYAAEVIEKHILPNCLGEETALPEELFSQHDARETLYNWIEQYPDDVRIPLRAKLMRRTAEAVSGSPTPANISTFAKFGLISPWTEETLRKLMNRVGPVGDAALNALCSLSPSGGLRTLLIREVSKRASSGAAHKWGYAIQELASPRLIPALLDPELNPENDLWLVPTLLGNISDRKPGNVRLQRQVWRAFREFQALAKPESPVLGIGNTLSRCNLPDTVEYLLENVGHPPFIPHIARNHLRDCYRPLQQHGWSIDTDELAARLDKYATLPGSRTRSITPDDMVREAAWDIAFRGGIAEISSWLSNTDANSPVATAQALEYASFTRLEKWPTYAANLVRERFDIGGRNDAWYSARLAAVKMVAATESVEALDLIIDCGLTVRGAPLVSTTEAAGDVAERLSALDAEELIEHLIGVCESRRDVSARTAAIVALQRLAELGRLGSAYSDRLFSVMRDSSLPDYATAVLVWVMGNLTDHAAGSAVSAWMSELLHRPETPENLRFRCFQALATLDTWEAHEEILVEALGLVASAKGIEPRRTIHHRGWQAYALGLLVARAPQRYWAAAKDLLATSGGDTVHLLLQALSKGPIAAPEIAAKLGRAAIERTVRVQDSVFGETDNFKLIAHLAPVEFLATQWETFWGDWMPQVRCALAESLEEIQGAKGDQKDRVLGLLTRLLDDSTYIVRRAAARAYSRLDKEKLEALCREWMRSGQTELRIRSTESAEWLPVDDPRSIDNAIIRDLLKDPEPSVRSAARRSATELRGREWRSHALSMLTASAGFQTGDVPDIYHLGCALVQLADDETIVELNNMADTRNTAVHVKNWLKKLAKDAEQHWKETITSRLEALPAWSGQIEEITTRFQIGSQEIEATMSLWQRRQAHPGEWASWGGAFHAPLERRLRTMLTPSIEPERLLIPGRPSANIWYSGSTANGQISFVGTGPYPRAQD